MASVRLTDQKQTSQKPVPMSWTPADLARMAQQYAQSLQAAGVEWLPARAELTYPPEDDGAAPAKDVDDMAKRKSGKATKTELLIDPMREMPAKELSTTEKKKRLKIMDDTEVKG